jgi:hypothetical protein
MDNLFCIHREQDVERYNNLVLELDSVDLKPKFIEPEPIDYFLEETNMFNRNMDSLRRTTIKIIQYAIDNNLESISIMEDDCYFDKLKFDLFLGSEKPKEFSFIHLACSGSPKLKIEPTIGSCHKLGSTYSCQFYIIHNSIFETYIAMLKENKLPIDVITSYLHYKRNDSYLVQPEPVYHKGGKYSTLRDEIVNY